MRRRTGGAIEQRLQELRAQFYAVLDRSGDQGGRWLEIWRLFANHPWYQEQLHRAAGRVVARSHVPRDWAEDIEQDAVFYFGEHLRRAVDLHINRTLAEHRFAGWLATIIEHDCATALRHRLAAQRGMKPLSRRYDVAEERQSVESQLDLHAALKNLPTPLRTIVILYSRGWPVRRIAARLGMSYWKVNRMLHAGLDHLARML